MAVRLYPYSTLFGEIDFQINEPFLSRTQEGRTRKLPEDFIDQQARQILLWPEAETEWNMINIPVSVKVSLSDLKNLECEPKDVSLILVAECLATQIRIPTQLSLEDDSTWTGTVELAREHFRGPTELKGILSGPTNGRKHRRLGETDSWVIHFHEKARRFPHGALDLRWVNFTESENADLRKYANEMVYVDVRGLDPMVYLNSDFEGLPRLFADLPRPSGHRLSLLESVRTGIAKSVWLVLFQASLAELAQYETEDDIGWPATPWKTNVLKMILPHIFPNSTEDSYLLTAFESYQSGDIGGIVGEAMAVISDKIIEEGSHMRRSLRYL